MKQQVAIVGGGLAGVSTASALRSRGYDGHITVIEAESSPYDRPPLSKEYLLGDVDDQALLLHPTAWYDSQIVNLRLNSRGRSINPSTREIELEDGARVRADHVVVATGGSAARPRIPGADHERVVTLRTVDDARTLKQWMATSQAALVIGGGLIGAEVSSTLAVSGIAVTLVEPMPAPMSHLWGHTMASYLHGQHELFGVTTIRSSVQCIRADGSHLTVLMDDGSAVTVDFVLMATGLVPEAPLADGMLKSARGGLHVDGDMRTSQQSVLAIGDAADRALPNGSLAFGGHWDSARRDGDRAAATILGLEAPSDGLPWFWTDRHGRHIETLGRVDSADQLVWRGEPGDPSFAVVSLKERRIVGAVTVDDSALARSLKRVAAKDVDVDAEALADTSLTPRELLVALSDPAGNHAALTQGAPL